ncbi:MAG TPA: hypothetical protein PLY45_00605, partial [bacterium]|nr:hypothetical protein [bacterium]
MKRTLAIAAALIALFVGASASAANARMLFWYPGEAGSSQEGQPVIDAFLEYLSNKVAPQKISGRYVNTVEAGLSYLRNEKPALGIVSYSAWAQNRDKLPGARAILSTLPLPDGKATERYELVALGGKLPASGRIISSEPISPAFARSELFDAIPGNAGFTQTNQMIFKLKEIAEGKLDAAAVLTPTEAASLSKMKSDWAAKLKRVALSKPVPSARVVSFDPSYDVSRVKSALLSA